jgi:predicted membrane protein
MRHRRSGVAFGSIVLALGVILLLDRQGIVDAAQIFPFFWPAVLFVGGVLALTRSTASGGRVWGGILTAAGILLFLDRLGYARFSFHALWPLVLIGVGLTLVWRTLEGSPGVPSGPVPDANLINQFAAFGGGELKSDAQDFQGGEVLTIMGGYQVDLRKAAIARSPAVLHANAMFGGIEIRVPRSWRIILDGLPLLGGYTDETDHPEATSGVPVPELIVKGFASFGGVVVKN